MERREGWVDESPAERRVHEFAATAFVGRLGLSITYGARVMDSTPPAMKTSPSPTAIA